MEFLRFMFQTEFHFLGMLVLIVVVGWIIEAIVSTVLSDLKWRKR